MEHPSPVRRWRQRLPVRLSVRALMVVVLISAGGTGWVVRRARIQRDAVAAIERAGGKAFYDWQVKTVRAPDWDSLQTNTTGRSRWPKWLVDRLGPDYFHTIKLVILQGEADSVMPHVGRLGRLEELDFFHGRNGGAIGLTDAGMVHLRGLTRLKNLKLGIPTNKGIVGSKITGPSLAAIAGATRLQYLSLHGVPLADADLAPLRGLTDLRYLAITGPDVTDAGLKHLAGLVEMRRLDLAGAGVTSAGIRHLRGMTRLHNLNLALTRVESLEACRPLPALSTLVLARTPIVDAGLAPAAEPGFPRLAHLSLFHTRVGDDGLMHLRDLPMLKRIDVIGTDVTDAGIAEFKKARPNVIVVNRPGPARSSPVPAKK